MTIEPFLKVGDLFFSDEKQVIRQKIGKYEEGVKKFEDIKEYYDHFPSLGLFVVYNAKGTVNAFEFFEPKPVFLGADLLQLKYHDLIRLFSEADKDLEIGYNDFTSIKYGIGGNTSDDPDDASANTGSVIVFRKEYYDQLKDVMIGSTQPG